MVSLSNRRILLCTLIVFFMIVVSGSVIAAENPDSENAPPPSLDELLKTKKENTLIDESDSLPFDIRKDAIREAALSYGARGGLAWRTYQIRRELEERASYLDKVYDFHQLLIPAPSGFMIEPPVISEALNSTIIENGGLTAAVSDRYLNIVENARIVSSARNWRPYLERDWGDVSPPPDVLRPENEEERKLWEELVAKGWKQGIEQADEIFADDLANLERDFVGMVRYRILLAQGMVSAPYALQINRGVTGGGSEMRVGDREVKMTGVPELRPGYYEWKPANR